MIWEQKKTKACRSSLYVDHPMTCTDATKYEITGVTETFGIYYIITRMRQKLLKGGCFISCSITKIFLFACTRCMMLL